LGKTGVCGISANDPVYPTMTYDWTNITEKNIVNTMKKGYILLKNENKKYTDGPEDQFIMIKSLEKSDVSLHE